MFVLFFLSQAFLKSLILKMKKFLLDTQKTI